jgi:hypothetical protein
MHEFVIMIDNEIKIFNNFDDIPQVIDHVIKFLPYIPLPPHTAEQHEEIEKWNDMLKNLMLRERKY